MLDLLPLTPAIAERTRPIYERVANVITPAEWDLFAETASQCVISCPQESVVRVEKLVGQFPGLMVVTLGETVADLFELAVDSRVLIRERVSGLRNVWSGALATLLRNDLPVGN